MSFPHNNNAAAGTVVMIGRRRRRTLSTAASSSFSHTSRSGNETGAGEPQQQQQQKTEQTMVATTLRLLDLAPGSFSTYTWRDGREALEWWTTQHRHQDVHHNNMKYARDLLDRLRQEREGLRNRMEAVHGAMTASVLLEQCYPLDESSYGALVGVGQDDNDDNGETEHAKDMSSSEPPTAFPEGRHGLRAGQTIQEQRKSRDTDFASELYRLSQQLQRKNKTIDSNDLAAPVRDITSTLNSIDKAEDRPTVQEQQGQSRDTAFVSELHRELRRKNETIDSDPSAPIPDIASTVNTDKAQARRSRVKRRQPQTDDERLAETILSNFVKNWRSAGLAWAGVQFRVDEFRKLQRNNANDNVIIASRSKAQKAFVFVLHAWEETAKVTPEIATKHADTLLYEMLTLYLEEGNQSIKPYRQCFSSALNAHITRGDTGGANRILQDVIRLYERTGDDDFMPDRQCFLSVLISYFKRQNDKDLIYKADLVLHQMLDLADSTQDPSFVPPDSLVQHTVALWAESYEKDAGERAEALLLRIQGFRGGNQWHDGKPPLKFFEMLMESWANSHNPKSAARIEKIQSFVKQIADKEEVKAIPPSFGYLPLLRALSRRSGGVPHSRSIEKVESTFREYEVYFGSDHVTSLDVILAYKARIRAYALYIRGSLKAAELTQTAFNELMRLRQSGVITRDPDATVYGALANAWAQAGYVTKVEQIMQDMSKDLEVQPNNVMFNYLLLALSRCNDPTAADKAEEVLFKLEEMGQRGSSVAPNIRTYGIVMACLANSSDPKAAARAELYLQKLKDYYATTGDTNFKPNTKIYTNAMRALGNSRDPAAPNKARTLLDEMNLLAGQGDRSVKPDVVTYTTFLQVLRAADVPDKSERAMEVMSLMKQNGVEPDSFLEVEIRKLKASG